MGGRRGEMEETEGKGVRGSCEKEGERKRKREREGGETRDRERREGSE